MATLRLRRAAAATPDEYSPEERAAWHRMLAYIAQERGYALGWIGHKYKEKFGDWPPQRYVQPMQPTPEVLSWVRSRQSPTPRRRQMRRPPEMNRPAAIPPGSWPRGLRLPVAAAYLGIGQTKFLELVESGRLPAAVHIDGITVWDRVDLDLAFEELKAADAKPNSFDAVLGLGQ